MKQTQTKTFFAALLFLASTCACNPIERCYRDEDCSDKMICNAQGECDYRCNIDEDCQSDLFVCAEHECVLKTPSTPIDPPNPNDPVEPTFKCPEGMASIMDVFCIDKYEASRADATATFEGSSTERAYSRPGVKPWNIGNDNAAAERACQAAGKRLCSPTEWEYACHGPENTVYAYGDTYDPKICNGLDTFEKRGFHITPTGSFENCTNAWGVYDMNGNLWEHTANGNASTVRGGAFNCVDSMGNHKCSYIPQTWSPLSMGFRCCLDWGAELPQDDAEDDPDKDISQNVPLYHAPSPRPHTFNTQRTHEIWLAQANSEQDTLTDAVHGLGLSLTNTNQDQTCISPDEAILAASSLWNDDASQAYAIDILKKARSCNASNDALDIALGTAYARSGNTSWALKTLKPHADSSCEARAWTAWTYLQMAMPDEAMRVLDQNPVCNSDEATGRLLLLKASTALAKNDQPAAQQALQTASDQNALYESDATMIGTLMQQAGLVNDPNFTWRIEINGGVSSNPMSSSPDDRKLNDSNQAGGFVGTDLRFAIDPWKRAPLRAMLEGQVTGQWLPAKAFKNASYLDLTGRLGLIHSVYAQDALKFGLYYKPDFVFLAGSDQYNKGPLLFYAGHRIEFDAEINKWLYVFGGYGHRTFRQKVRTRDEVDLGAGGFHTLPWALKLTWGLGFRNWLSSGDMYDLNGFNLSLALDRAFVDGIINVRLGTSFAYDDYAKSKGYFDASSARNDTLWRANAQLWFTIPSVHGLSLGLQVKYAQRWSSAPDYAYDDARAIAFIRWSGEAFFYNPKSTHDDVYALPWNSASSQTATNIRDIIQQDEDLQRTSSCLKN